MTFDDQGKITLYSLELNYENIIINADRLNWNDASLFVDLQTINEELFTRFKHDIVWDHVKENKTITTEFAHKYEKQLGGKFWYKDGKLHSHNDQPAAIYPDGEIIWCKDGRIHREGGPAIIHKEGFTEWYKDGREHRDDGPAVEWGDYKVWFKNGVRHRVDGPAVFYSNGSVNYFINGKMITENKFIEITTNKGLIRALWFKFKSLF